MRRLYYSDDEFGKVFSDKLKDYPVTPSSINWSEIASRLDKKAPKKYSWLKYSSISLALILLFAVSINYSSRLQNKLKVAQREAVKKRVNNEISSFQQLTQNNKSINKTPSFVSQNNITQSISITDVDLKSIEIKSMRENNSTLLKNNSPVNSDLAANEYITSANNQLNNQPTNENNIEIENQHNDLNISNPLYETDNSIAAINFITNVSNDCAGDFYFGINFQPQQNFLLSNSAVKNPNLTYKFLPGYAYGLVLGYQISSSFAIEMDGMVSRENEGYRSTVQSKRVNAVPVTTDNNIQLNYYRLPLLVIYKLPWKGTESICNESINIVGGVQYGRFKNGTSQKGVETVLLQEGVVKKNDLSFVAGLEKSKVVMKHFVLNYGLRVGYGFEQISAANSERINEFYKPHNLNTAVTLSVYFKP